MPSTTHFKGCRETERSKASPRHSWMREPVVIIAAILFVVVTVVVILNGVVR